MTDTTNTTTGPRNLHEQRFAAGLARLLFAGLDPADKAVDLTGTAVARALDDCRLHLAAGALGHTHDDPEPATRNAGDAPTPGDDGRLREYADLLAACGAAALHAGTHMIETGELLLAAKALQVATAAVEALQALAEAGHAMGGEE